MNQAPLSFHLLAKPAGAGCNLACDYCFFLSKDKLYPGSDLRMSDQVLEEYIRQYIQAQQVPQATIAWQGGEPTLMGLDFFRRSVELARKYRRGGMEIQHTIQTNGTTLNDEWCSFFKENGFLVGISLDGPSKLHDKYRRDKRGRPTFSKVMAGLELLKKHKVDFNILASVHRANVRRPLDVYRFFRDKVGAEFIQFIAIVERDNDTGFQEGGKVTRRSVKPEQYGSFLCEVFDEWVRRDVGTVFVQLFDAALGAWVGAPGGLCIFSPTCGTALVLEHNGDLYSCDHFVEPGYLLGNIMERPLAELVASDKQRRFGRDKLDKLPQFCRSCNVLFACRGGCPKNRFSEAATGERCLNYLCAGYKYFYQHIGNSMETMAGLLKQKRAPAEIMQIKNHQAERELQS
ncbi:anaerobic sulfatase-maturating enzyme [bacterium BMS3Abin01]|nr:anaerobic sulfatase-maturating enzyme [bacterium BMS3Abin01]